MLSIRERKWTIGVLAAALALTATSAASAQASPEEEIQKLRDELSRSMERIDQLSERLTNVEGSPTAAGEDDSAERLDLVEDILFDLDERVGDRALVHAFDAIKLDIGGFLTQQYTVAIGEEGTEDSFNATQFELLIGADVTKDVSIFTALGFLREADLTFIDTANPSFRTFANRTPLIIGWANYHHSDALEVRAGRFVTPHGIINVEHFPPVLLDVNQPQFLRPFSGNTIFPNFITGVDVHGKFFLGDQGSDVFSYNVYAGVYNGPNSPDNTIVGARGQYKFGDSGFTAGANYSHGRRTAAPGSPLGNLSIANVGSLTTNDYDMVGADLLYDKGKILWKTELFWSHEHGQDDRFAFYTQPAYRVNDQWIVFYRFDFLDAGQGLDESYEHVVGVNYLPVPTVRLRGEYIFKDFDSTGDQAHLFQLSATVSF